MLPDGFVTLEGLVRFVASDDLERSQAIETATDDELGDLVSRVQPLFERINGHLDHIQDDAACALGDLAQAACEAQFELKRRHA